MKKLLLIPFLLAIASTGFGETLLYRSNSFGMLLEPIAKYRRDQTEWVMQVERSGTAETRRLFEKGAETRRWVTAGTGGGETTEREYAGVVLVARRIFDTSGAMLQEEQYADGALAQKTLFTYSGGRLLRVRVQGGDGAVLYTEDYLYAASGALRQVKRTPPAGDSSLSAYVYGPSGLAEERTTVGETTTVDRYDPRSRVIHREKLSAGVLVSREDFTFRPDSDFLISSIEKFPADGRQTERRYDEKGLLAGESTSVAGKVLETIAYVRDDQGRVTSKSRRAESSLEVWHYTLDDAGKLVREAYSVGGMLAKATLYGEEKLRTEELYKEGELFLKVFYDGDTRLREEVYVDGVMARERHY